MAETKKIMERSEIPEKDRWAIEDLYPSDEAWSQDLSLVSGPTASFSMGCPLPMAKFSAHT